MQSITPRELCLWGEHLREFPLDEDRRLHHIVASIWVLLMHWCGAAKKGSEVSVYTVAPWLRSQKDWEALAEKKRTAFAQQQSAAYYKALGLYDEFTGDQDG